MKTKLIAVLFALVVTSADAQEMTLLSPHAAFPEGPLVRDGDVLYTELVNDKIVRVADGLPSTFWSSDGCGPTGLATADSGEIFVACNRGGKVIKLTAEGEELAIVLGAPDARFSNPNDIASDGAGGFYVTDSGPVGVTDPSGRLFHIASSGAVSFLADKLAYANGIALSPDSSMLLVGELYANLISAWDVGGPGEIARKRTYLKVADAYEALGVDATNLSFHPDGMKYDAAGQLLVALWSDARILVISADGRPTRFIETGVGSGVTNLALGPDGSVYLTIVYDKRTPFPGALYQLRP